MRLNLVKGLAVLEEMLGVRIMLCYTGQVIPGSYISGDTWGDLGANFCIDPDFSPLIRFLVLFRNGLGTVAVHSCMWQNYEQIGNGKNGTKCTKCGINAPRLKNCLCPGMFPINSETIS